MLIRIVSLLTHPCKCTLLKSKCEMCLTQSEEVWVEFGTGHVFVCVWGWGETWRVRLAAAEAAAAAAAVVALSTPSFKSFELEVLISRMKRDCLGITLSFSPPRVTVTAVKLTRDDSWWQLTLAPLIHDISAKFCLHQRHRAQTGLPH